MPLSPGFPDYVQELIAGFGKVDVKRMFGGAALYRIWVICGQKPAIVETPADPIIA